MNVTDNDALASRLEQLLADVGGLMSAVDATVSQAGATGRGTAAGSDAVDWPADETAVVRQYMAELLALLEESTGQVEDAVDGAADACSSLLEQSQDHAEAVVEAIEGLVSCLDDGHEALSAAAEETSAQVDSALAAMQEAYEQHAQIVGPDSVGVLERQLLEDLQDKAGQAELAFGRSLQQMQGEASAALDQVSTILTEAIEQLVGMVESAIRGSQGERSATQAAADVVQVVTEPIRREIERVADLASTVGISL